MNWVVAAVRPTPILCWRASGLASPNDVPASTLPARGIAPVRANIASRSVVLPLWKGPTSAMHRGPRGLLTSCPIRRLLVWSSALDWVGKRRCSSSRHDLASGKTSLRCIVAFLSCCRSLRGEREENYRPGRSSRLSSPAATLSPTWPCRLSGCKEIELPEPPPRTFPPPPTPTDALPCAPA